MFKIMAQLPFRCAFSSGLYHARLSIHSSFDRWKDVYVNNNKKKKDLEYSEVTVKKKINKSRCQVL